MSGHDDELDSLLETVCDCETYHLCEWHQRLKDGERREDVIAGINDHLRDLSHEQNQLYCKERQNALGPDNPGGNGASTT